VLYDWEDIICLRSSVSILQKPIFKPQEMQYSGIWEPFLVVFQELSFSFFELGDLELFFDCD